MTGTASTFTEYNTAEQQQGSTSPRLLNRLSGWVFGYNDTVYSGCRLVDISEYGGALLIPTSLELPHDLFYLIIHHPADKCSDTTIARARLRWSDIDHSESYSKVGFMFESTSRSKQRELKDLAKYAMTLDTLDLECRLTF